MKFSEYQQLAAKTESSEFTEIARRLNNPLVIRLLHASKGFDTEGGEFADGLKKHIFYGKELDPINLAEELGDLMWYVALACNALGIDLEQICKVNINKLESRYPQQFTAIDAISRDLDGERQLLCQQLRNHLQGMGHPLK